MMGRYTQEGGIGESMKNLDKETLEALRKGNFISADEYNQLMSLQDDAVNITSSVNLDLSLQDIFRQFDAYLKDEFSANTAEGYSINVRNFLEFIYDTESFGSIGQDVKFVKITESDVRRWFHKLASNGYTYSSVRRFKHSIKKFFEFSYTEFGVDVPVIDQIELPELDEGKVEIDAMSDDAVRDLADHATTTRNKAIILLMYDAGMRRQELIDCKKEHIDFDNRKVKLFISGRYDRLGMFTESTKEVLEDYLDEWSTEIKEVNDNRFAKSKEAKKPYSPVIDSEYLFQTVRSPQLSYSTIFKAIKDASYEYYLNKLSSEGVEENEVKTLAETYANRVNTETLRHSRRAFWFAQGKSIEQVQAIMGDENRHVCRRYLKIAQRLYPEKFF
jgi:site-specific recombinase XerD